MSQVTREDAIKFLETACRNWSRVPKLSEDDIGDVASELLRFVLKRTEALTPAGGGEVVDPFGWVDMKHGSFFTHVKDANGLVPVYASPPAAPSKVVEATHRHVKRGTEYVLVGVGKIQSDYWADGQGHVDMREVAIYRAVEDGSMWARPRVEFEDGRFEALTAEVDGNKPS